jgi:hypothetical protein
LLALLCHHRRRSLAAARAPRVATLLLFFEQRSVILHGDPLQAGGDGGQVVDV